MTTSDLEYLFIFIVFFNLFIFGLKKREKCICTLRETLNFFIIDKDTSIAIKGLACVFVLMGHYGTRLISSGDDVGMITKVVTHTTANIALAWFMFFSGYGLSLKSSIADRIGGIWISRLRKLYFPLSFVCLIAAVMYLLLPELPLGVISSWYDIMHHISANNIWAIIYQTLGLSDWYVVCIIYFVSLFYLAIYIAKKTGYNLSLILGTLLLCYIGVAYWFYGLPQAHYYRYPWAFMLGHLVASHNRNSHKVNVVLLIVFFLTWGLLDKFSILSYLIAILVLAGFGFISNRYEFKGKVLSYLGGLSYFFYLSHERVGWPLIILSGIEHKSMILWVVLTLLCSIVLQKAYNLILQNK